MKILKILVLKSLLLVLFFSASGNLFATTNHWLKIETDGAKKSIVLSFKTNPSGNASIQIKDPGGAVLYQEQVAGGTSFSKKYNLQKLPAGTYYVSVSDELKNVVQPVEVSDSVVRIDESERMEYHKPVYRFQNNRLDIDFLSTSSDEVLLEIFDTQNQLLYSKTFKTGGEHFGKRMDLSKLKKGKYNIVIGAGNQRYSKTVKVG